MKEKNLVILTIKNKHDNGIMWSNDDISFGDVLCKLLMVDEAGIIKNPSMITELKPEIKYSLVYSCRFKNLEKGRSYYLQSFSINGEGLVGRYGDVGSYSLLNIEFKENSGTSVSDLGYADFFK